jgi:hypothetical protein
VAQGGEREAGWQEYAGGGLGMQEGVQENEGGEREAGWQGYAGGCVGG